MIRAESASKALWDGGRPTASCWRGCTRLPRGAIGPWGVLCVLAAGTLTLILSPSASMADDQTSVEELRGQVAALEARNKRLEREVLWLRAWLRGSRDVGPVHSPLFVAREEEATRLELVRLPDRPLKDDVRTYVARILGVSMACRGLYSARDPCVARLKEIGGEHVDVLLEALELLPVPQVYISAALIALVDDGHKQLILGRLRNQPTLVEIVAERGWTRDAAPVLLESIRSRDQLETRWVEVAATVARPEHYKDLLWHVVNGMNPYPAWLAIRKLPGMPQILELELPGAWEDFKREHGRSEYHHHQRRELARVMAHYGALDALALVALNGEAGDGASIDVFRLLTGYQGETSQASAWLKGRVDRLVFSPSDGRYHLRRP